MLAAPHFRAAGKTFEERIAWVNETGLGVIGTPDNAIAQVERLEKQSGGFGSYLLIHHEWARHRATLRSYELFANYVKPRFQGSASRLQNGDGLRGVPLGGAGQASGRCHPGRDGPARQGACRRQPLLILRVVSRRRHTMVAVDPARPSGTGRRWSSR